MPSFFFTNKTFGFLDAKFPVAIMLCWFMKWRIKMTWSFHHQLHELSQHESHMEMEFLFA